MYTQRDAQHEQLLSVEKAEPKSIPKETRE